MYLLQNNFDLLDASYQVFFYVLYKIFCFFKVCTSKCISNFYDSFCISRVLSINCIQFCRSTSLSTSVVLPSESSLLPSYFDYFFSQFITITRFSIIYYTYLKHYIVFLIFLILRKVK